MAEGDGWMSELSCGPNKGSNHYFNFKPFLSSNQASRSVRFDLTPIMKARTDLGVV